MNKSLKTTLLECFGMVWFAIQPLFLGSLIIVIGCLLFDKEFLIFPLVIIHIILWYWITYKWIIDKDWFI